MFVFVFVYVAMCLSSFAIILTRKRELITLLVLSFGCPVSANGMWLFLAVLWVGLKGLSNSTELIQTIQGFCFLMTHLLYLFLYKR